MFEETGQWVKKGVKPDTIPPLFRKIESVSKKDYALPVATTSASERVRMVTGFLSVQEKDILRTASGWFTAGLINFYATLRLKGCNITYQPAERSQRGLESVLYILEA